MVNSNKVVVAFAAIYLSLALFTTHLHGQISPAGDAARSPGYSGEASDVLAPPSGDSAPETPIVSSAGTSRGSLDMIDMIDMNLDQLRDVPVSVLANAQITGASKQVEKASDAPATVYLITKEDIRLRGYSMLKDALRDVPGLETIENYFSEIGTLVPVRGVAGNNKILVLINGTRVSPPGGEEMMLRSDFSIRTAERIEIIYGPGSMIYGQDAISAIVNVITTKSEGGQLVGNFGQDNFHEGFVGLSRQIGGTEDDPINFSAYFSGVSTDLTDLAQAYPDYWAEYRSSQFGAPESPRRWDEGYNVFGRVENKHSSFQMWYRTSSRSSAEGGFQRILYYVDEAIWKDESFALEGRNVLDISDNVHLESRLSYNRYQISPKSRYVWPSSSTCLSEDLHSIFSEFLSRLVELWHCGR